MGRNKKPQIKSLSLLAISPSKHVKPFSDVTPTPFRQRATGASTPFSSAAMGPRSSPWEPHLPRQATARDGVSISVTHSRTQASMPASACKYTSTGHHEECRVSRFCTLNRSYKRLNIKSPSYVCTEMRQSRERLIICMMEIQLNGETVFILKQDPQPSCSICSTILFKP